jgi:hypothetical protein
MIMKKISKSALWESRIMPLAFATFIGFLAWSSFKEDFGQGGFSFAKHWPGLMFFGFFTLAFALQVLPFVRNLAAEVFDCGDHLLIKKGGREFHIPFRDLIKAKVSSMRIDLELAPHIDLKPGIGFLPEIMSKLQVVSEMTQIAADLTIRGDRARREEGAARDLQAMEEKRPHSEFSRIRISASTLWPKKLGPVLACVFLGYMVWETSRRVGLDMDSDLLFSGAIILVGATTIGYFVAKASKMVDEVLDCGDRLLITKAGEETFVALGDVVTARFSQFSQAIELELEPASRFGAKIAFIPAGGFGWKSHSKVTDLVTDLLIRADRERSSLGRLALRPRSASCAQVFRRPDGSKSNE